MIQSSKQFGGLRSMRRIPVALTPAESSALNWLSRYATELHVPKKFHGLRKKALHRIIKAISARDLSELVLLWVKCEQPTPTP